MTEEELTKQFEELKKAYIADNAKFKIGDEVITREGDKGNVCDVSCSDRICPPTIWYRVDFASGAWSAFKEFDLKPLPKPRPFANAEELDKAIAEHGIILKNIDSGERCVIVWYNDVKMFTNGEERSYDFTLERYTFLDGTPFGVKEDE